MSDEVSGQSCVSQDSEDSHPSFATASRFSDRHAVAVRDWQDPHSLREQALQCDRAMIAQLGNSITLQAMTSMNSAGAF